MVGIIAYFVRILEKMFSPKTNLSGATLAQKRAGFG